MTGMEVIGADVGKYPNDVRRDAKLHELTVYLVEVAPIYDNPGETTLLAAAEVVHSLLALMVNKPVKA